MAQHIPVRRRRLNVHPIQQKYFFLSLVPLFIFAFFLIVLVLFPLNAAFMGLDQDLSNPPTLGTIYAMLDVRVWVALLISMFASCLLSYFVTNKFAGHLYRLEQILRRGKEGNLPIPVHVRRGDDLQEFAELLNANFKVTASALAEIHEQQALAAMELAVLQTQVKAGSNGEVVLKGLEGIDSHLKEVENILAHFKFPTG